MSDESGAKKVFTGEVRERRQRWKLQRRWGDKVRNMTGKCGERGEFAKDIQG